MIRHGTPVTPTVCPHCERTIRPGTLARRTFDGPPVRRGGKPRFRHWHPDCWAEHRSGGEVTA